MNKAFVRSLLTKSQGPFLEDEAAYCILSTLLERHHIKTVPENKEKVSWNGETLAISGKTPSDVLHEICHYVLATPEQRTRVDYGLGAGFDTDNDDLAKKWKNKSLEECTQEEEEVSLLGILLEKSFGLNHRATMEFHQWIDIHETPEELLESSLTKKMEEVLGRLRDRGLITKSGRWTKKAHRLFF